MASQRIPGLRRQDLPTPEQQTAHDTLEDVAAAQFGQQEDSGFIFKDATGAFVGPFPFFLESPDAGLHFLSLFRKLAAIPGLPRDARETAILTVGARYEAGYETYSHTPPAIRKAGLARGDVETLARGGKPEGLSEACSLAHDVAVHLITRPGKLSDELWERSVSMFGKQGTVALVHYM